MSGVQDDQSSTDHQGSSGQDHSAIAAVNPVSTALADAESNQETPPQQASPKPSASDGSAENAHQAIAQPSTSPTGSTYAAGSTPEASEGQEIQGMQELLEQYATPPTATNDEGEIFDGHVIAVTDAGVVVDVGGKFEGLVPAQEFAESGGAMPFGPGQTIEVERLHEHKDGYVLLSHLRAHRRRSWEKVEKSAAENQTLNGKVVERIKGGLVVDIGVRAFLPASQIDLRPVHNLEAWKDRDIEVRILKLNRKRGNVVVSRRVILEEEGRLKREALAGSLTEGSVVKGKVKNITDYGVFVDLGGIDGLLHITDLTWGRVKHPSEVVKAGDEIEVKILKFDKEKSRISLGRKQLLEDPWSGVPQRYPVGTRLHAKVVSVTDYGAFVEVEPGIEGLIHVSEMSWSRRTKHPSKVVKVGDEVDVVVLEVKSDQQRISLGLRQTLPDPWQAAAERFPVGSMVKGSVRGVTEFGAFVEIDEGLEGLIHISDMSWTERVKHPSEKFKKGDTVEAKVLKVDVENRRLSLGIKQINDIWANWFAAHHNNDVIKGKVSRVTDFGAFVELAEGIEGLCHISEIEERRPKGERDKDPRKNKGTSTLAPGKEYDFKIIRIDDQQHKIGLSYRAAQKQAERKEIEAFRSSKSSPTATIGDAILAKRQNS
jgi:small subunit ribosomal protein S1